MAVLVLPLFAALVPADEKLKGIACRSVHLGYPAPEGTAFYNEVAVETSADGTYFMVCGWGKGYFGSQELASGKKLILFSVWDPASGEDPRKVPEDKRVKLLHKGEGVRVGRFGNEGTGGQSFFDYDWKPGETYRFLVTAKPDGPDRTAYSGYFYLPEKKEWRHLVTFSTPTKGDLLKGYYSFVEDFRRNRVSATKVRKAQFGNGWVRTAKGAWEPLVKARFTADSNPVLNIDAGAVGPQFFLATGGGTENKTTKLREVMTRAAGDPHPPADLPKLDAADDHAVMTPADLKWVDGPASLPKGAKMVALEGDPAKPGEFVMRVKLPDGFRIMPHTHPKDERVTVLSGTLYLGMGGTFDEKMAKALPAGSYGRTGAGMQHFGWAKGETVLQVHGTGPWAIEYVNPADDPRKK
jgi:quercetin dioxygenase-like cupin family protein